jgi:carbamoyl-phosphate synthase large subunit
MRGKRVFVTGGAGVIGMELIPGLIDIGAEVLVGDLKPQPEEFKGLVRYRQGDLNEITSHELISFRPDILIHLAATFERSTETLGFWGENFKHNVTLGHHLMTLAQGCKTLSRVIFASSYLVYDERLYQFEHPQDKPRKLAETDVIRPRNLTGMAKLAHEQELAFLTGFSECQFSSLCVRIFRGYGCRSRDVISRWVRSLIDGDPITVYRPEGIFDYINSADSAEGLLRLAKCDQAHGIVNLGTGKSRRVSDVVNILRKYFPLAQINYDRSDIPFEASESCTSKLESLIGWRPKRALEETIPEIIRYEQERKKADFLNIDTRRKIEKVLVTSASRKISLIRELKSAARRLDQEIRVVAADADSEALSQYEADEFWNMSRIGSISIKNLIEACVSRKISVVLPTRDGELDFWARNKHVFLESGIEVVVSTTEAVGLCRDKLAFSEFCARTGLCVIPSATTPDLFGDALLVVKERFGSASRGLGLALSRDKAVEHAKTLESPIFQPFISGPEISIDSWVSKRGKVAGIVLRRREVVVSGESQVTTTFRDKALEHQATRFIEALKLRGPVVLQAILVDGQLHVIECNPRFGGASTAAIAVGLESLYWSLAEIQDDGFEPTFNRMPVEIRQVRVPVDHVMYGSHF